MRERLASRTRLDLALVERGVVSTRSRAQEAIVSGLVIDSFLKEKLKLTQKELMEERDLVSKIGFT